LGSERGVERRSIYTLIAAADIDAAARHFEMPAQSADI